MSATSGGVCRHTFFFTLAGGCIELYGGYCYRFDVAAFAVDCVKVLRTVSELFAGEFDGSFSALSLAPFPPYLWLLFRLIFDSFFALVFGSLFALSVAPF